MNGNIYIPEPCHENWNKMSPTEKGRHCEVCSKVVTDFSKMKKQEILTTLKDSKEEICGHIPMNQLTASSKKQQVYFWIKGTFIPKMGYAIFGILGLASIFKKSAFAQNVDGRMVMVNGGAKYQAPTLESKKVNVVVVDEKNTPVKDATVTIKINDVLVNSAITDVKGECSNMVEIQSIGYSLIDIEVDAYGYKHKIVKQIRVSRDNQTYRIKLDEEMIFLGKMKMVETPVFEDVEKPSGNTCTKESDIIVDHPVAVLINSFPENIQAQDLNIDLPQETITNKEFAPKFEFENNTLSFLAFPNPTLADLTIQTQEEITFDVKIFNESGALVLQLLNQYQRAQISLEGNAAGNYFAMIFINNKAIETHKIILIR